tara:strand:+ start:520 stop:759 length:240 start_codon:yes stop_codon:yes gene_type:complete
MKIALFFVSLIAIIFGFIYFFKGYKSAFEADQQCHYELKLQSDVLDRLGCDHDLETNQWLLFQEGLDDEPSRVIKRFRY